MTVVVATNNAGKLREIRGILEPYGVTALSLSDAGVAANADENGRSFAKNAEIKARAAACEYAVLADDSGLCVDALGGRPGIHTARYAGEGSSSDDKMEKLLAELSGQSSRAAHFYCSVALLLPNGMLIKAAGICRGSIAHKKSGAGGFGYDPIFVLPDGRGLAEISEAEKNTLSHRGRAIKNLMKKLKSGGYV